jgi:hypothetical protein
LSKKVQESMGLFSREPDWATIPIGPDERWARHAQPHPDLGALAREIVARSNRTEDQVDVTRVLTGLFNVFVAQASRYLAAANIRNVEANLDKIFGREDFTADMPWDFLTHLEATGVAAHNQLAADLTDEEFVDGLVAAVNDGTFDQ